MSLDDFVSQNTNKQLSDHSGNFLGECVSLVKQYAQSVQNIPNADIVLQVPDGARQLYEGFDWNGKMSQYYDKIPYGQPRQKGDLVVWGENLGKYGDVAIALDSDNTVFGQLGTPVFIPANIRVENRQPLGYLRLKGEDIVKPWREGIVVAYQNFEDKMPTEEQIKAQMGQKDMRNVYESLMKETNALIKSLKAQATANYEQVGVINNDPVYRKK